MLNKKILFILLFSACADAHAMHLQGPVSVAAGSNPRGLAAADLDADGIPEILVANFGAATLIGQSSTASAGSIQIFKSEAGSGPVAPKLATTLVSGGGPRGLAVLDLNGDSRPDIIATFYDDNAVGAYLQKADHSFSPYVSAATGTHPVGVAAALVGGSPLVAVANYSAASVSLYGFSGGGLVLLAQLATGASPTDVKIHEEHGEFQLVTANYGGNSVTIYPLSPGGKTGARQDLELLGNPCKIAFGDLNGDSQDDLAVALFTSNGVAVFYGEHGVFSGKPVLAALAGQHPNGLAIGRVSGATAPLLIAADRDSDQMDILKFGSDGAFSLLTSLFTKDGTAGASTAFGPVEVMTVDLGASGHAGIVATHMRTGTLKVFSQLPPGAPAVSSSTHPDPARYFPSSDARFHFDSAADLDGIDHYVAVLDQKPGTVPMAESKAYGADAEFSGLDTGTYTLHVRAVDKAGNLGELAHFKIGVTAELSQANTYNYPNPSRDGKTTIRFTLLEPVQVVLRIYDETGHLVWSRDLSPGQTIAGVNNVAWDGRNDAGQAVGNGGYILQVQGVGKTITKKIAIVR
jgi:hypothetical protein